MKTLFLGASGIIGQHARACVPAAEQPLFFRKVADADHLGCDLESELHRIEAWLDDVAPAVIVNLAGENRVDVVEKDAVRYEPLNVELPARLAGWCSARGAHYIHVSSQAVFSGDTPPYGPRSPRRPVNFYGVQKKASEDYVMRCRAWTIIRFNFILGVRLLDTGRRNPIEDMLACAEQVQTNDRWFSPCFAPDAARRLWRAVAARACGQIQHVGLPLRVSRYDIARRLNEMAGLGHRIEGVASSHFPDIAPRPVDTTWAATESDDPRATDAAFDEGLALCYRMWTERAGAPVASSRGENSAANL